LQVNPQQQQQQQQRVILPSTQKWVK
jgi:hypothetical protein